VNPCRRAVAPAEEPGDERLSTCRGADRERARWEDARVRIAFLLTLAAYGALVVAAAAALPGRVPLHYGMGGDPDRWGTRTEAVVTFALVGGGLAAVLGGVAALASRLPLRSAWVNLPHKTWWTATPEREQRARQRLRQDLYAVAAGVMVLLFAVLALTIAAARGDDARLPGGPVVPVGILVVALAAALALVIWMPRRYRPETES
jgi:hypothetical protein